MVLVFYTFSTNWLPGPEVFDKLPGSFRQMALTYSSSSSQMP